MIPLLFIVLFLEINKMKCRVIERNDGKLSIVFPNPNSQRPNESEDEFLERAYQKTVRDKPEFQGLPYVDMEHSELPLDSNGKKKDRDKWRMSSDKKGVKIDNSVVTETEKRKAIEDELETELAKDKSNFDVKKAMNLQHKLNKRQYD
jgi:hypothetical protein